MHELLFCSHTHGLGSNVPLFEALLGSVRLPPESVGAVQPVSKSIELILL